MGIATTTFTTQQEGSRRAHAANVLNRGLSSSARSGNMATMSRRMSSPSLVGRERELELLQAALIRASDKHAVLVQVTGEAGIGKSRLLAELSQQAREQGWLVAGGSCVQFAAGTLPYAPMAEILARLQATAVSEAPDSASTRQLLPEFRIADGPVWSTDGQDHRYALLESVATIIESATAKAPVLLIVEDIHWAARSTLDLLRYLAQRLSDRPLALGLTVRSDEPANSETVNGLAELLRLPDVERVDLTRLSRADMALIATGVLGLEQTEQFVDQLWRRSEGNPFFGEEILATGEATGSSATLRHVTLARMSGLSTAAVSLVRAASVGGRSVSCSLLQDVLKITETEMTAGVREAFAEHVLEADPAPDVLTFRHALVQEAVYGELVSSERKQLHANYAELLESRRPADPSGLAVLANHWDRAGSPKAIEAHVAAGMAADRVGAYSEALSQFSRALELLEALLDEAPSGPGGLDRGEVVQHAAQSAWASGDPALAVRLLAPLLADKRDTLQPMALASMLERLSFYELSSGDPGLAATHASQALSLAERLPDSESKAALLTAISRIMLANRDEVAASTATEALRVARSAGSMRQECRALRILGVVRCFGPYYDPGGLALVREAVALAQKAGDSETVLAAGMSFIAAAGNYGLYGEASEVQGAVDEYLDAKPAGLPLPELSHFVANAAQLAFLCGRWLEADALLRAPELRAVRGSEGAELDVARTRLAAGRGLIERAEELVVACELATRDTPNRLPALLAEIHSAAGRWAEVAQTGLAWATEHDLSDFYLTAPVLMMRANVELWETARARGDASAEGSHRLAAEDLAQTIERITNGALGHGPLSPWTQYVILFVRAELARVRGEVAPDVWRSAADSAEAMGSDYWQIYPRFRCSEAMLRQVPSRRAEATLELRRAHDLASSVGAIPLLTEINSLAERARVSLEPTAPTPAPDSSLPTSGGRAELHRLGLTSREIEVLEMLVQGRTNRQIGQALFTTEKTAATHVSRILGKLGVANRVEAAAVAHRLHLDGQR